MHRLSAVSAATAVALITASAAARRRAEEATALEREGEWRSSLAIGFAAALLMSPALPLAFGDREVTDPDQEARRAIEPV
jgi:hypothetical protein